MGSAERLAAPAAAAPALERAPSGGQTLFEVGGWYYDPRSSQPILVRLLAFEGGSIVISGPGVDVECGARELRISPPVLGATLDAIGLPSGAQCELFAKAAVEQLRELAGRPVPFARIHRWERSWALSLAAAACVIGAIAVGYLWAIPLAASRVALAWPALAQRIGRGALTLLDTTFQESRLEPSERARLQALFAQVAADYPGVELRLALRQAGVANAFALPDGTLVLSDELVRLATDDAQLLGVLFHEVGHVVHGHGLRRAIESSLFAAIAMAYYGEADHVTALAGGLPIAYARSRYSREEEADADGVALEGLFRHGRDARHYAEILRALERASGPSRAPWSYFSSHPATVERIDRIERPRSGR